MTDTDYIDEEACIDGYPEHDYETTYEGPDGVQDVCRRCNAETWTPAEEA